MEGRQQETELVLEVVQVGNQTIRQGGRLEDEALGHVATAPEVVKHNQVVGEKDVWCALEHRSDTNGCDDDTGLLAFAALLREVSYSFQITPEPLD